MMAEVRVPVFKCQKEGIILQNPIAIENTFQEWKMSFKPFPN